MPMQNSTVALKKLSVIGAGQMGVGIAYVTAVNSKMPVLLIDTSQAALKKGTTFVDKLLARAVSKNKITEAEAAEARGLITVSTDMTHVKDSDIIIEAVPESLDLKCQIFGKLAQLAPKDAILGSNTSSISISKIGRAAVGAEDRVIGIHFMNPVPVQSGVEIIKGLQTSNSTHQRALKFIEAIGKRPSTSKDSPGFLANRILIPYINEAIMTLENGVGTKEDIDSIMRNGCAMPMGPLALADFVGLDTCLAIMKVLYNDTGDTKYRPAVLLGRMVDAGFLGVKSGKGFYDYSSKL